MPAKYTVPRLCTIEGCDRVHMAHGWCLKHYQRYLKRGSPTAPLMRKGPTPEPAAERFLRRVIFDGPVIKAQLGKCWLYQGAHNKAGYAHFGLTRCVAVAGYRFAYELLIGPIPEGLCFDHLCENRGCVNPCHGELVTLSENVKRSSKSGKFKTHCPKGHPYDMFNTVITAKGSRLCRECGREASRRRYIPRK